MRVTNAGGLSDAAAEPARRGQGVPRRRARAATASISTSSAASCVAIVGPSGSGKTTLLQIMGTLDRPTAGEVSIDGFDAAAARDDELSALRARRIGFVFQQFYLLDGLSAVDNVAGGLLYAGLRAAASGASARARRSSASASATGSTHQPDQLSGGEKQRTAIARALVGGPAIVFADEPTGALDTRPAPSIVELLRELNAAGTTIVVITHDIELAEAVPAPGRAARRRIVARRRRWSRRERHGRAAGRRAGCSARHPRRRLDRPAHPPAARRAVGARRRDRHRLDGRGARHLSARARPTCSTQIDRLGTNLLTVQPGQSFFGDETRAAEHRARRAWRR